MRQIIYATILGLLAAWPARAQGGAGIDRLAEALMLPEIIEVMRIEGLDYGEVLAGEMFPGRASGRWQVLVDDIYNTERMAEVALAGIEESLGGRDLPLILAYFESEPGQRILRLELSAREALLDEEIEALARERAALAWAEGGARVALLDAFIEANALVDYNVAGALNASFAFYRGLAEGGALGDDLDEGEVLADVWSQEEAIRQDTREWLRAYLLMAYGPLSDAELQTYVDLSRTPEGRALNAALFAGFDRMYVGISYALGLAAADILSADEL